MAIFLGSNKVDLKIGTSNEYWHVSCVNIQDLTSYYQKQETYSRSEVLSSLKHLEYKINRNFYSKEEIDATISAYEIEYRIRPIGVQSGIVQLQNRVQNVISPSGDVSCVVPRTIKDNTQLGRDFLVQVIQPEPAVDVEFIGYDGESVRFATDSQDGISEMEGGKRYLLYFNEISGGTFFMKQHEVNMIDADVASETTAASAAYAMYDLETNFLNLSGDTTFVFPERVQDISGNWLPRDFRLVVAQPSGVAYDVDIQGHGGESLAFCSHSNSVEMKAGSRYMYCFSELSANATSALFYATMTQLFDVRIPAEHGE